MPINPDAVGMQGEPFVVTWDSKDCLLYAVGIGAGAADLPFSTENSRDNDGNIIPQQVYPTFPVILTRDPASPMRNIGTFNPAMLVHGQQAVTLHRAVPVEGSARVVTRITGIYDKGKGAVVASEQTAVDASDGSPLFSLASSAFIRGEGGWGGDRGPGGDKNVPPARKPDHSVTYQTAPDQAYVYRLSGDRNPLHSDPTFAAMGGFDRPILHGLCTYGFTGRALLAALCANDASGFTHIEGRFASPVIAGEALTISIWETGSGEAVFTTSVGDRTVLDQGLVRFRTK
jgi:acyl dehydratase